MEENDMLSDTNNIASRNTTKKVLILVNHGVTIYNFRRELVERLLNDAFDVTISAPYDEKVDKIIKMGCHFINTPIERHGTSIIEEIQLLRFYKKIIADTKPDIVLTYTVKPNIYGGIACKSLGIPYISSVTGLGNALVKKGVLQKITIFLYKFATSKISRLFLQNEENMKFFEINRIAIGKHRIVSGSGVNLLQNAFEPYPDENEPIRLLFIGRIMREKGIDELAKAAVNVKKLYPHVVFDAIGFCEDEYKPMMEAFAKTGEINFLGPKSDVHEYLKHSHAVVMPSHHEGMSNALLEAASVGRPVIASIIPGCVETFDEGISGMGFEVRNAEDLTNKLLKFIELPYESKVRMGIAGRTKMEAEFDRQKVVDAYMDEIYTAINIAQK